MRKKWLTALIEYSSARLLTQLTGVIILTLLIACKKKNTDNN
jgi:hypothetical protein